MVVGLSLDWSSASGQGHRPTGCPSWKDCKCSRCDIFMMFVVFSLKFRSEYAHSTGWFSWPWLICAPRAQPVVLDGRQWVEVAREWRTPNERRQNKRNCQSGAVWGSLSATPTPVSLASDWTHEPDWERVWGAKGASIRAECWTFWSKRHRRGWANIRHIVVPVASASANTHLHLSPARANWPAGLCNLKFPATRRRRSQRR